MCVWRCGGGRNNSASGVGRYLGEVNWNNLALLPLSGLNQMDRWGLSTVPYLAWARFTESF